MASRWIYRRGARRTLRPTAAWRKGRKVWREHGAMDTRMGGRGVKAEKAHPRPAQRQAKPGETGCLWIPKNPCAARPLNARVMADKRQREWDTGRCRSDAKRMILWRV